jgi:ATP/ADP translocase/HEAT repeat protein
VGVAGEQLRNLVGGLLRIHPGEGRKTALMFGVLFCVVGSFIIGRVARDSLFLSNYPRDYLPYLYIWVAIGVSLQSYGYSWVADRFRRDRLLAVTLALTGLSMIAARVALYWVGDWFYPVLWVLVELIGSVLIIQAWTLANDVFNSREAKRLFGLVGAGGVVSAVVVGLAVKGALKFIGTADLLFLGAGGLMLGLLLTLRLAGLTRTELLVSFSERHRSARHPIALFSDWNRIFSNRHLVMVASLVVVVSLVLTFVDYQFKVTAAAAYPEESALAGFFGMFWALTGALSCLIQFFLTGRVLERFGILFALLMLPFFLLGGAVAWLMKPMLYSAMLLKGTDAVLRYTVNDSTTQLLYVPVPAHWRGRAKAFIDGMVRPLAIGVSGVILAWIVPALPGNSIGWLLLALVLVWLIIGIGVRTEYLKALANTLHNRRFDFDLDSPIPDQTVAGILRKAFQDSDDQNVLQALEMTRHHQLVEWREDLYRLAGHASPDVRAQALTLLGERAAHKDGPVVFEHLEDPHDLVQAAAVTAYCAIGKERAIPVITRFLEKSELRVRSAAVIGLIRYGGLDGVLSSAERLKSMLQSADADERAASAYILGEIRVRNFYHPLLVLLTDPVEKVRIAAIRAAATIQSPELLPALVYRLEDLATRAAASEALAAFGALALKVLQRVLDNNQEALAARLAVPAILARIGGPEALEILLTHLDDPNERLRTHVLESIHRLRVHHPYLVVKAMRLQPPLAGEIAELYRQAFIQQKLDLTKETNLLADALNQRFERGLRRVFCLLGCIVPVRTIDVVYNSISAPSSRMRANAIELLDNLLDKELKRRLLPLLDQNAHAAREQVSLEILGAMPLDRQYWLSQLLGDHDPWIIVCTIHAVVVFNERSLISTVQACTESGAPVIRETALWALSKLLPKPDVAPAITPNLNDSSTRVRAYAGWLMKQFQDERSAAP